MINLAGVKECDKAIREELYLAGIEVYEEKGNGEVPYTIIGKIGNWVLKRAWTYWVARVENREDGLLLEDAMKLHYRPNPIDDDDILGKVIRSGGHAGSPSPDEYGAQPVYCDELYEKLRSLGKYNEIEIGGKTYPQVSVGEVSLLNKKGVLDIPFYVDTYHIDDQIGLNEFVRIIKNKELKYLCENLSHVKY